MLFSVALAAPPRAWGLRRLAKKMKIHTSDLFGADMLKLLNNVQYHVQNYVQELESYSRYRFPGGICMIYLSIIKQYLYDLSYLA